MKRQKVFQGTCVRKVEAQMGYPLVFFTDDLNGHQNRWQQALYFRKGPGEYGWHPFDYVVRIEHRKPIIDALDKLAWQPGRNCLASAPWLH